MPEDYPGKPAEALSLFCGRYLEILTFEGSVRMMRVSVSMAASGRFQEQVAAYYDVLFTQVHARLGAYVKTTFGMSARASAEAAHRLMGQVLYPRLQRALFGLEPLAPDFGQEGIAPEFDLKPVRKAVVEWMESLES